MNNENEIKKDSSGVNTSRLVSLTDFIKSNKYPLLITLGFFLVLYYVAFFHHLYWTEVDGIYYLNWGEEILNGNGRNVKIVGAQIGGPVLFAALNSILHDGFFTEKLISLLNGSGIVLFSYYIIRNIFNSKIALIGQLLFAFNPRLHYLSISALNELLPIFLISASLYFITKKQLKLSDIVIVGSLLGASSMIKFQAVPVLFAILVFLLIRNKKIRTNLWSAMIMGVVFLIIFSPVIIYNYNTHGVILDNDINYYLSSLSKYQTPEWHDKMISLEEKEILSGIFLDFELFLKNYFYNLFYHNVDKLFNMGRLDNLSIIPPIPFLGIIPVIGGLVYSLKTNLNKIHVAILFGASLTTAFFVFLLGDFSIHFFAIVIIPLLVLGIRCIRNVETNFLPLLILPVVYFIIISVIPVYRSFHLLPIWISVVTLSSVFFIEVIPKLCSKIISIKGNQILATNKIVTILFIMVLLVNVGFSYKLIDASLYGMPYSGIKNEFFRLFEKHDPSEQPGIETKIIGEILSKQLGIENSYVMGNCISCSYYANSKFVFTELIEGVSNDPLDKFITRENWTLYDVYVSNIHSNPPDRYNVKKSIPDYLIYQIINPDPTTWYVRTNPNEALKVLADPTNPDIPSYFEVLYQSNRTSMVVYKINHNDK
ncbi:MAG: glycosyltransferase family 39 protein [Nitrosopumilaceae archaeon]